MDYSNKLPEKPLSPDALMKELCRMRDSLPAEFRPEAPIIVPRWLWEEMERVEKER